MNRLSFIALVMVGCANVPSEDDPRRTSEYTEDGTCSGIARDCDARLVSACDGGCEIKDGCASPYIASCASAQTPTACDAMSGICRWSSSFNQCQPTGICDIWDTPGECAADSCVWGQKCDGYVSCYDYETAANCRNQGCTWEVDDL